MIFAVGQADDQGMSDLLSPIYYVFDANEADSFWGLEGVMKIMVGSEVVQTISS